MPPEEDYPTLDEHARLQFQLWTADALVLFDWLMRVDLNAVPIEHPAEKQALADLLNRLEVSLISPTQAAIDHARELVARDMGW